MAESVTIAILFSGRGSNLENLIKRFHNKDIDGKKIKIAPLTNRPDAPGIELAKAYGIETAIIDHKKFGDRESFDAALVSKIKEISPRLVVMAGFMRILTNVFTSQIEAINLHPSLLPLFKGANAIEESFGSGMRVGGVTVHYVDSTLDGGKIIDQKCVRIEESDTLESFRSKIQRAEHELLPAVITKLLGLSPNEFTGK